MRKSNEMIVSPWKDAPIIDQDGNCADSGWVFVKISMVSFPYIVPEIDGECVEMAAVLNLVPLDSFQESS